LSQRERKSINILFRFINSVRGDQCDYSHQAQENPVKPLLLQTAHVTEWRFRHFSSISQEIAVCSFLICFSEVWLQQVKKTVYKNILLLTLPT